MEIKCQGGKLLPGKAEGCCGASPALLQFPLPCAWAGLCPDPSSGHQDPWDPLGHQGHSRTRCPKEKILPLCLQPGLPGDTCVPWEPTAVASPAQSLGQGVPGTKQSPQRGPGVIAAPGTVSPSPVPSGMRRAGLLPATSPRPQQAWKGAAVPPRSRGDTSCGSSRLCPGPQNRTPWTQVCSW